MSLYITHKEIKFGIGDKIRVIQKIEEGGKTRSAYFEGILIAINGRDEGQSITVRRIGEQKVGIERIFPINLPSIEKIEVVRKGTSGVRRSKLYYLRGSSPKEIEKIYAKASARKKKNATSG